MLNLNTHVDLCGFFFTAQTKVIIVIDDVDVKDVDVKSVRRFRCFAFSTKYSLSWLAKVLRRIHAAYVDALCNPFHVPGERLNSGRFDKAVLRIIGNF